MDDVWKAPETAGEAEVSAKTSSTAGELGDPTDPAKALFEDLKNNVGGYLMAGLGYLGAVVALVTISLGAIGLGVAPGLLMEDETILFIGLLGGFGIYTVAILVFSFIGAPLMLASMIRAADAHLDGEGALGLGSSFNAVGRNAGTIIGFYLVQQVLVMIGILMLYIPGFIAMAVCHYAFVILVIEEVTIGEALSRSFEHMKNNVGWHLIVWIALMLLILVAELTLVGLLFVWPAIAVYGVLVHRAAKG